MKSSQSSFNLRSPGSYLARSYLIATVLSLGVERVQKCPKSADIIYGRPQHTFLFQRVFSKSPRCFSSHLSFFGEQRNRGTLFLKSHSYFRQHILLGLTVIRTSAFMQLILRYIMLLNSIQIAF